MIRQRINYASACDGIGAAHVAWQPLGWQCQWTSEIEPFPAAVVKHHYGFRNLGDMTAITEEMLDAPVDLLVGGTPCQSFSVAGLRGGLADPRGNLALRFVQLAAVMQPRWIVWENVPGVLSSGKGRDFGTFLGALAELGYGFAYRVLDAQWFGVAQRRRRVFVVGHLGDWRRAAAVLFERESVFGNPPTRGAKGKGTAARAQGGPDTCGTLCADRHPGGYSGQDACTGRLVSQPYFIDRASFNQGENAQYEAQIKDDGLALSLVARGPRAVAFKPSHYTRGKDGAPPEVAAPLSADADKGDQDTVVAQGFTYSGYSNQPAWMTGDRTDCLPASGHSDGSHQGVGVAVALQDCSGREKRQNGKGWNQDGTAYTVDAAATQGVASPMAVRRLTPRECERLQGFPDDYTLVTYRNKPAADGPRYRALGNSMAVPVMRWIGERIAKVEKLP